MLLQWNSSLEVGVAEIDIQHKHLVDLLNGLNIAMKQGDGRGILGQLIHGLGDYIIQHFSLEERYMQETGFPKFDAHHHEHQKFVKRIIVFDQQFKSGNVLLTVQIMHFLRDWVREHIAGFDQELGRHLRQFEQS